MFRERRVDCGRHGKLSLCLEKGSCYNILWKGFKTRYNQLTSMKRYLAREKWSLPWRIIKLKKLKKNWCIDFIFWHAKNSKNKSEWERLWLRWENKIMYPWENVTCTRAKKGAIAVQSRGTGAEPCVWTKQTRSATRLLYACEITDV